jgi:hypothetical protein
MRKPDFVDALRMNQLLGLSVGLTQSACEALFGRSLALYAGQRPDWLHAAPSEKVLLTFDTEKRLTEFRVSFIDVPRGETTLYLGGREIELVGLHREHDVDEVAELLRLRELPFRRTESGEKWNDQEVVFHFDRGAKLTFWYSDCISGLYSAIFASPPVLR